MLQWKHVYISYRAHKVVNFKAITKDFTPIIFQEGPPPSLMAEKNSQVSLVQYLEMGSLSISWYVTLMHVEYCLPCQAVKHSELTVWCGGLMSRG